MHPTRTICLTIPLALLLGMPLNAAETIRTKVAPGVELVQTLVGATEKDGPAMIHTLIVDPRQDGIRLAAALGGETVEESPGNGMEAVNKQVVRTGALAGLNADFFPFTGDPLGLAIQKGELVSEPLSGRGAIGFRADGSIVIGRPAYNGAVTAEDGAEMPLAGLNRKPGAGEMVLLAPVYGETTPEKAATLVTLDASGATPTLAKPLTARVVSLMESAGKTVIPRDRLVLSATGAAADWLRAHAVPGKTLTVRVQLSEPGKDWSTVTEAVAGGPVLLTAGKPDLQLETEKMAPDFSTTRHPRSAVGVTKDGKVLLVAVDGRQILSRGMSLPELTTQMVSLGAVDALNLDGGGSTCLSLWGVVINSPSDGRVRSVADSLLVYTSALKETYGSYQTHDILKVTAGATAVPAPGSGAEIGQGIWGTANGGAFVDQKGRIYGYKGGQASVAWLTKGGWTFSSWPVEVLPGPAGKMLTAWKDGTLEITIRDMNNNPVQGQEVDLTKPDGTMTEVTTGADGIARVPAGWLADENAPATITSGILTKEWGVKGPTVTGTAANAPTANTPAAGK